MKQHRITAALAGLATLLAACNTDDGRHELTILLPHQGYHILYADAERDSLAFLTLDSWSVSPQAPWMKVDGPTSGTIAHNDDMRYLVVNYLDLEPNTTGHTRRGMVNVKTYDYEAGVTYVQLPHIDITHPAPTAEKMIDGGLLPDSVSFALTDSAFVTTDSIRFTTRRSWQIETDGPQPEWLALDRTEGLEGTHTVRLTLRPNTEARDRTARLRLTSARIEHIITLKQLAPDKAE